MFIRSLTFDIIASTIKFFFQELCCSDKGTGLEEKIAFNRQNEKILKAVYLQCIEIKLLIEMPGKAFK